MFHKVHRHFKTFSQQKLLIDNNNRSKLNYNSLKLATQVLTLTK